MTNVLFYFFCNMTFNFSKRWLTRFLFLKYDFVDVTTMLTDLDFRELSLKESRRRFKLKSTRHIAFVFHCVSCASGNFFRRFVPRLRVLLGRCLKN